MVAAVNDIGKGANSSIASTTTWNVPGQVTGLVATAGDGHVSLSWTAPADGGTPITGYKIYRNDVYIFTVDGDTTSWINTGLVNGQFYAFFVVATNDVGDGQPSFYAFATPVPNPPIPGYDAWLVVAASVAALGAVAGTGLKRRRV